MSTPRNVLALVSVLVGSALFAAEETDDFVALFNGKDFSGWKPVNTAPSTWSVKEGMIVCTGRPTGELRTERMYQNFILEIEWRHMVPKGNAGIFVWADDITARGQPFHRGIEVQVLENAYGDSERHTTHGDIFPIHGAKMTPLNGRGGSRAFPTEKRSRPSPQWNHYRITCNDGAISLAVNGEVVTEGKDCSPRKGYICLESEGGVVHYRNLRIRELPDTAIDSQDVATADRGYRCLYNGIDLSGWVANGQASHWRPQNWILRYDVSSPEAGDTLETRAAYGDIGFIFDIRCREPSGKTRVLLRGSEKAEVAVDLQDPRLARRLAPGKWSRFEGTLRGDRLSVEIDGHQLFDEVRLEGVPEKGPIRLVPGGPVEFANIYVRELEPDEE